MTEYRTLSVEIDTKDRFKEIRESLDVDTQTDALDRLIADYQFRRLKDDKRIQEAREAVAQDHGVDPEEVSLPGLLKVTAGAYCGYQQTADWQLTDD